MGAAWTITGGGAKIGFGTTTVGWWTMIGCCCTITGAGAKTVGGACTTGAGVGIGVNTGTATTFTRRWFSIAARRSPGCCR